MIKWVWKSIGGMIWGPKSAEQSSQWGWHLEKGLHQLDFTVIIFHTCGEQHLLVLQGTTQHCLCRAGWRHHIAVSGTRCPSWHWYWECIRWHENIPQNSHCSHCRRTIEIARTVLWDCGEGKGWFVQFTFLPLLYFCSAILCCFLQLIFRATARELHRFTPWRVNANDAGNAQFNVRWGAGSDLLLLIT